LIFYYVWKVKYFNCRLSALYSFYKLESSMAINSYLIRHFPSWTCLS